MKKLYFLLFNLFLLLIIQTNVQAQTTGEKAKPNVAILIYNGVEIIDYTGPYEVFGQAQFNAFTVAEKPDEIKTSWGMRVLPNYTFENHPKPDILMIPGGGIGLVNKYSDTPVVQEWIKNNAKDAKYVLSVCNGAFFLSKTGLLDGLEATTTASLISDLRALTPKARIVTNKRVTDNGKVITSGGLSAGIEGALHVVSKYLGEGGARSLALGIEYNWDRNSPFLPATLARRYMGRSRWFMYDFNGFVSNSTGTENQWEETITLHTNASAEEISKKINENLVTNNNWKSEGSANKMPSLWSFTDETGAAWNGRIDLQNDTAEKNKWLVTIKIKRPDNSQVAKKN